MTYPILAGAPVPTPDLAVLALWLADARLKYHQLMTGQTAVEIAVDGATFVTKFAKPDADKLAAYILRLEGQIQAAGRPQRGPGAIGITFN